MYIHNLIPIKHRIILKAASFLLQKLDLFDHMPFVLIRSAYMLPWSDDRSRIFRGFGLTPQI